MGDAFVARLNPSLLGTAQFLFSTYLGGCDNDGARRVVLDATGSVYLVGSTSSSTFPTTPGAYQSSYAGNGDGFIAKIFGSGPSVPVLGCGRHR